MGIRKLNIIAFILSMICSVIALIYMPDVVPAYFDTEGNVVRYASKYEMALIYPVVSMLVNSLLDFIEKKKFDLSHRHIAGFFKTYFILFFAFENIKTTLNIFNINININIMKSGALVFIVELLMLVISWQYNIIREKNSGHRKSRRIM